MVTNAGGTLGTMVKFAMVAVVLGPPPVYRRWSWLNAPAERLNHSAGGFDAQPSLLPGPSVIYGDPSMQQPRSMPGPSMSPGLSPPGD